MIQIENRAEESDHGEDDDHAAYYLTDNIPMPLEIRGDKLFVVK